MNGPALEVPSPAPAKKQPNRQRSNVERFRTDEAEHAALHALADESGLSFGAFMRAVTIGNPGLRAKRRQPTADTKLLARNMAELNRIGVNINQGIRALHDIARTAPEAVERDRLAYELQQLRQQFTAAFGELAPVLAENRQALGYDREG